MTGKNAPLRMSPGSLGPLTFLSDVEPLPLVDPTGAAQFLNLERHSLACYRSLDVGPPFYKFGRWIRYATADLQAWRDGGGAEPLHPLGPSDESDGRLVGPAAAARFLTITSSCLRNNRVQAVGPRYCRLAQRLYYPVRELHLWAQAQRH
jgi:hypothetical protein